MRASQPGLTLAQRQAILANALAANSADFVLRKWQLLQPRIARVRYHTLLAMTSTEVGARFTIEGEGRVQRLVQKRRAGDTSKSPRLIGDEVCRGVRPTR